MISGLGYTSGLPQSKIKNTKKKERRKAKMGFERALRSSVLQRKAYLNSTTITACLTSIAMYVQYALFSKRTLRDFSP